MEVIVNLWAVLLAAGLPAGTNPGVLLTPSVGDLSTLHEQVNSTTANHLDGVELYSSPRTGEHGRTISFCK